MQPTRPAPRLAVALLWACAVQGAASAPARPEVAAPAAFEQGLQLQGIGFQVSSPNKAANNTVHIVPSGLQVDNNPIDWQVAGHVVGAEVADLNADGSPELYVYVRGPAPWRHGALLAFSANQRKSLSMVNLPELGSHRGADKGYQGHDEMAARREPVHAALPPVWQGRRPRQADRAHAATAIQAGQGRSIVGAHAGPHGRVLSRSFSQRSSPSCAALACTLT
jgi:hypothetical protein